VPPGEHAAIFERFHRVRTTREVRGSGIGLSLVARIAQLHGAQIEIGAGFGNPGLSVRVLFPPVA
jgi:signal transduction histidine kinase